MKAELYRFPALGEQLAGEWNLVLAQGEIHLSNDSPMYESIHRRDQLPLYEGKTIAQFDAHFRAPRYWVRRSDAEALSRRERERRALKAARGAWDSLAPMERSSLSLDIGEYRLAFRDVTASRNERSMICAILPPNVVAGHTLKVHRPWRDVFERGRHREILSLRPRELLYVVAMLNSFVIDSLLRTVISIHMNISFVNQLPIPRLSESDPRITPIALRAAKLMCTTSDFERLAKAAGMGSHRAGVTDPEARSRLRAEIDGLVAHLYGLTEGEFVDILRTFPIVAEPARVAAHNAYRAVARGDIS